MKTGNFLATKGSTASPMGPSRSASTVYRTGIVLAPSPSSEAPHSTKAFSLWGSFLGPCKEKHDQASKTRNLARVDDGPQARCVKSTARGSPILAFRFPGAGQSECHSKLVLNFHDKIARSQANEVPLGSRPETQKVHTRILGAEATES